MSTFHEDLEHLLPDLNRFARVLTRNEDDAYDLVQDCVERALRKRELFNDGSSLKSWLFTVMRNIFISQRRRVRGIRAAGGPRALLVSYGCELYDAGRFDDAVRAYDRYLEGPRDEWTAVVLANPAYTAAAWYHKIVIQAAAV